MKTRKPDDLIRPEKPGKVRLVYSYSPRRSFIISGVFLAVVMAAGLFLFSNIPALRFMMGVFALGILVSLRRECSVRIWTDWPYVLYEHHSIFRHIREYIPPWEITGLTNEIVSMWRGNISERLILQVGDRKLVVSPYYSPNDEKEMLLREAIGSLPDSRRQAEYELELEHRALHPEEYVEEEPEPEEVWGFLEMSIECPRCDGPVIINGPFTQLVCPQCSADIDMSPSIWADLLEDVALETAEECREGTGSRSTIWGTYNTDLLYGRYRPYCPQCKRDFDLQNDTASDDRLVCPDCGTEVPIMEPPEWFCNVFPGAFLLAGAEEPSSERNLEGGALKGPVVFTCSKCGAAVSLDGSERTEKCEHCDSPIRIPDDLWLRMHPAAKKRRWFVGYRWQAGDSSEDY